MSHKSLVVSVSVILIGFYVVSVLQAYNFGVSRTSQKCIDEMDTLADACKDAIDEVSKQCMRYSPRPKGELQL